MKKLLFFAVLLTGLTASADLKLTMQANGYNEGYDVRPEFGIKHYLKPGKLLGIATWAGYGAMPIDEKLDYHYFGAKTEVQFYFKKVTVAPGVSLKYDKTSELEKIPFVKLEWKVLD